MLKITPLHSLLILPGFISLIFAIPTKVQGQEWQLSSIEINQISFNRETANQSQLLSDSWQLSQHQHHQNTDEDDWGKPIHDDPIFWLIKAEQLEYRNNDSENTFNWDIKSWIGRDYHRFWIKTEGDIGLDSGHGEAELQLLYSQLISPFWELQAGIRYDQQFDSQESFGRGFAVLGVQGLAPYFFEIDTALFISHQGDISARFTAEHELLLSQRLILQPKFEMNLAAQTVERFGVGSGLNDIEFGLRLRYEISRQVAPYVGINWERKFGNTADLAKQERENISNFSLLGGIRLFF